MKKSLVVCVLMSLCSVSFAQESCRDRVSNAKEKLAQVERDYSEGKATRIDVVDAKLALTEDLYSCAPYVKYNYCKYRQDLLNYKISLLPSSEIRSVQDELDATINYCIHPDAKRPTPTTAN